MKRIFAHLIVGSVLMTLAGAAHAQGLGQPNQPVVKPLTVKVGAFFPTDSRAKKNSNSTQISAGIDYAFGKTGSNNPSLPSVYVDYNGGNKNGGHVNSYGAGIGVRSFTTTPAGNNKQNFSPYFGAGVGVYRVDIKDTSVTPSVSGTTTSIGGKVLAGVEFGGGLLVEANYQMLPSRKGVNPSGFGVQVGARF